MNENPAQITRAAMIAALQDRDTQAAWSKLIARAVAKGVTLGVLLLTALAIAGYFLLTAKK